jgi:hypothetical protein
MKRFALMAMAAALAAAPLFAQSDDGGIETDEDALFGTPTTEESDDDLFGGGSSEDDLFGGSLVEDLAPDTDNFVDEVLAGGTTIGGRYSLTTGMDWYWNQGFGEWDDATFDEELLSAELDAMLFLDARPDENLRVFLKGDLEYPFEFREDDPDTDDKDETRNFDDVFHITELFSDFDYKDAVFFRGGKQTINWGVGYFYSPANLLNITTIDPEDPEAEQEGPLAVKMQYPFGINNAYLYVVPQGDKPDDTIIAPKLEFVVGGWELGMGGLYRPDEDIAPSLMTTVSGAWRDFDLFAEGIARYGSDRTFVTESDLRFVDVPGIGPVPVSLETDDRDDEWFLSATAGFRYSYTDDDGKFIINLLGQYFYNAEGYTEEFLDDNATDIGTLVAAGEINILDVAYQPGEHYAAASASWTNVLDSDLSIVASWIANLSDESQIVLPSVSWRIDDGLSVSANARFTLGESGDEYSPQGDSATYGISLSLGGGSF